VYPIAATPHSLTAATSARDLILTILWSFIRHARFEFLLDEDDDEVLVEVAKLE